MRIIKYRIWDSKIKQYATEDYQFLISRTGDLWGAVGDWLGVHFSEDDGFQIEQYTGVDDADGQEIYEGDILQDPDDGYVVGKVEYDWGAFVCSGYDMYDSSDYKVIGNIRMNPELLEAD
jgi:hypothetical protein